MSDFVHVRAYGDCINVICNKETQIEGVIKRMSTKSCVFQGYEEWDEGKDMKWILTFKVLDDFDRRPLKN
tara:strand:+ start:382 stop:591 length:210 start_codon:yes stop_codon:yes gene_type:complete